MKLRERTTATLLIAIFMISAMVFVVPAIAKKNEGVSIQDGELLYSSGHYLEGEPLVLGFDPYGYNYQGHMFKGSYANAYLGRPGCALPPYGGDDLAYYQRLVDEEFITNVDEGDAYMATHNAFGTWAYRDVKLAMKWDDAWISNEDNDNDGELDRHYGHDSYIGSGAWLTNHQSGEYTVDGETFKWNYFVKIVAVPVGAVDSDPGGGTHTNSGTWSIDGTDIGPEIWGAFAKIQWIENDPGMPAHGAQYISPYSTGYGVYQP